MLSGVKGLCSPEVFAELQKIFDSAWEELDSSGRLLPEKRDEARTRLASIVMDQMLRSDLKDTATLRAAALAAYWGGQK